MIDQAAKPVSQPSRKHYKTRKADSQLGNWMHRHKHLLALIGAGIVFATFILKDALKEKLGDLVSSIDKAQNVYLLRNDMSEIRNQLQALQVLESERPIEIAGHSVNADIFGRLAIQFNLLRSNVDHNRVAVDNCEQLLAKLPKAAQQKDAPFVQRVEALGKATDSQLAQIPQLYSTFPDALQRARFVQQLQDNEIGMQIQTSALADKVLKQAQDANALNERRYEIATWASWFLYALGWGLGLAGRLVGADGIGEGGD